MTITSYLLILLAALIILFLLVQILLVALEIHPLVQQNTLTSTIKSILAQIWLLLATVSTAFLSAIDLVLGHILSVTNVYLLLGPFAAAAFFTTQYNSEIIQTVDQVFTKDGVPLIRNYILPIGNSFRVSGNLLICWSNLVVTRMKLITTAIANVVMGCVEADWPFIVNAALDAFRAPFTVFFEWTLAGFGEPVDFFTISNKTTHLVASIQPIFNCACLDLSFAWNTLMQSITSPNLSLLVNDFFNAQLQLLQTPWNFFFQIFTQGPWDCTNLPHDQEIQCLVNTPPNFGPLMNFTNGIFIHGFKWLDDVVNITFDQFFGLDLPKGLPKIAYLLSPLPCITVSVGKNIADTIFHLPLVFDPDVLYLQYLDLDTPFGYAYNFTSFGIDQFFGPMDTDFTDDLGCTIAKSANITVQSIEFATKVFIQLVTDPDNILDYIKAYNKTTIEANAQELVDCANRLVHDINGPLGDVIKYVINAFIKFMLVFVDAISNIKTIQQFLQDKLATDINRVIDELDSASIAAGNLFRQFNMTDSCGLIDPVDFMAPLPDSNDFMCCLGNTTDSVLRFILDIIRIVVNVILQAVSGDSAQSIVQYVISVQDDLIEREQDVQSNLICLPTYVIPTTQCPSGTSNYRDAFTNFLINIANITAIPIYGTRALLIILDATLGSGVDVDTVACDTIVSMYDLTIGNGANAFQGFSVLAGCLVGSGGKAEAQAIVDIGNVIWKAFGWDSSTSLRNLICEVIAGVTDAIQFFANFFSSSNPILYLFQQIETYVQQLITVISACINAFFHSLGGFVRQLVHCLECIILHSADHCVSNGDCSFSLTCGNSKRSESPIFQGVKLEISTKRDLVSPQVEFFGYTLGEPGSPCYDIYQFLLIEENNGTRHLLELDLKKCLVSAGTAQLANQILGDEVIPNDVLYDPISLIETAQGLYFGLRGLAESFADAEANETWADYAIRKNITDKIENAFGRLMDRLAEAQGQNRTIFGTFRYLFGILKKYTFDLYYKPGGLKDLLGTAYEHFSMERVKKNLVQFTEDVMEHNNKTGTGFDKLLTRGSQAISNMSRDARNWFETKWQTNNPRVLRNRYGAIRIFNRINNRLRYNLGSPLIMMGKEEEEEEMNGKRGQCSQEDIVLQKRGCSESFSPCLDGKCLNCTLLDLIIDNIIDGICQCVNDTEHATGTAYIPRTIKPNLSFFDWFKSSGNQPVSKSAGGANSWIINIYDYVIEKIFGIESFFGTTVDSIGTFFTNKNETNPDSFVFWIRFAVTCQPETDLRCINEIRGFGLLPSIEAFLIFFAISATIGAFFFPPLMMVAVTSAVFSPIIIISAAYLTSPWCFVPTPLPAIPDCLFDDMYGILNDMNVDCINWNTVLPGFVNGTCPTSATNYLRDFPICKDAPYSFIDGFRNIFFWLEWKAPSVNNFLRETTIPAFSWIYSIPLIRDRMTFDFGPSGRPNDTWVSCFETTAANLLPAFVITAESLIITTPFLTPMFLLVSVLFTILSLILLFIMEVLVSMIGLRLQRSQYYEYEEEIKIRPPREDIRSNTSPYPWTRLYRKAYQYVKPTDPVKKQQ